MKRLICLIAALLTVAGSASADSLKTTLGVPDHAQLSFTTSTGKTSITIDAVVEMPDVASVTTYELMPRGLTENEALNIVHAVGYTQVQDVTYALADETPEIGVSRWSWGLHNAGIPWKDPDGDIVSFSVTSWQGAPYASSFLYKKGAAWRTDYMPGDTRPLSEVAVNAYDFEEARQLAVSLAERIAPEMTLHLACGVMGDQTIYGLTDAEQEANYDHDMIVPAGYEFCFTRELDGIPVTPTWEILGAGKPDEAEYYMPWIEEEMLTILVTDQGIIRVDMGSPHTVIQPLEQGLTELVPFDTIVEIAQSILPLKYVTRERTGEERVVIDRVSFGYMRVRIPYDKEKFMLIPVWDFFGNSCSYGAEYDGATGTYVNRYRLQSYVDRPVLTINALNGLVIDREYGY